jgi:hypothetical protein
MKRTPFIALCQTFRQRSLVTDREGVSVEEQVAMFLHVVGHNQRFRVVRHPLGGLFKQYTNTSIKCCIQLVNLGMN